MKKYSLSVKMFVLLTLFLAVSLIILNLAASLLVMKTIEEEMSKNSISKLKVAENAVVGLSNTIIKETVRLSVMAEIKDLETIQKKGYTQPEDLFLLSKALDNISHLASSDVMYHSIYVYLEDIDRVINSNGSFEYLTNFSDKGWLKYYEDYKREGIPLRWLETRVPGIEQPLDSYVPEHVLTYLYPLTPYTTTLRGAIIVNIRENAISSQINSSKSDSEGHIFIINDRGKVISHVDDKLTGQNLGQEEYVRKVLDDSRSEGYLVSKVDGGNTLVSFLKLDNSDWVFVGLFSLDNLIAKSNKIRLITIYISALVFIIGCFLAFWLSRRLSNPLRKLIQDISSNREIDVLGNKDEMVILHNAFSTLKKMDENLFDIIKKNKIKLEEGYLYRLFLGSGELEDLAEDIDLGFVYPNYLSIIISIDKYKEFKKKYESSHRHYIKMLMLEICEQIFNKDFVSRGISIDDENLAILLNHNLSDSLIYQRLKGGLESIQLEITKAVNCTISIGVGKSCSKESEVRISYEQALGALRFKLKYGYGRIIFSDNISEEFEYYFPFSIERHIINQLDSLDTEGVCTTVAGLINELKEKTCLSCDNITQILNQLVGNTIVKYLMDSHINMIHVFGKEYNIYGELAASETLDDIRVWLINNYKSIIEYRKSFESNITGNFDMIMNYIQKNYKEDIGIRDIADHIDMSYSHVRKIFKDETGKNITDYINAMRIDEAKNYLLSPGMGIKEIANALGYNNIQGFTRAFKRMEGITPAEYRNKIR